MSARSKHHRHQEDPRPHQQQSLPREDQLSQILHDWHEAREKVEKYEKKIEKYRELVKKQLEKENKNSISVGEFKVTKTHVVRSTISKQNVPEEIWNKYSKKSTYDVVSLTKNKK